MKSINIVITDLSDVIKCQISCELGVIAWVLLFAVTRMETILSIYFI